MSRYFLLFAEIPYHNYTNSDIASYEGFYASVIFAWLSSYQFSLVVEDCTNKGRIDMSVETDDTIFLIEFKVEVMRKSTRQRVKKMYLLASVFPAHKKNVTEFLIEDC